VFFCREHRLRADRAPIRNNWLEICIRLESDGGICRDIVNGVPIRTAYPHAVWKMPMQESAARDNSARKALALLYPPESVELFTRADLIPVTGCITFSMNERITQLTDRFFRLVNDLYSPGVADQLDWLGFSLIKEILLTGKSQPAEQTMEQKINAIASWLKVHCTENTDFHALARCHNLTYTQFYREWKHYIDITPRQYIINSRLDAAAGLLKLTQLSVSKIVERINFSGEYAFYRRFEEKFGMTPAVYRDVMKPRDKDMVRFHPPRRAKAKVTPLANKPERVYSSRSSTAKSTRSSGEKTS
jgi:AraC-like DNA-binding protein